MTSVDENGEPRYVPALRFRWLTPAYDVVVRATTRERRRDVTRGYFSGLYGCDIRDGSERRAS